MEISAKQATKCKNSHAQWYLSEKNVKSHARRPKEGDKSFRPEEEADEDDQDDEDVEADTHPTEEEAAKPQCIAHPIKALLASEADDAMAALWDKKELTDAEQAVKDRIDELLPYLGKNERRVLALKVYYMVRKHGAGIGTSLQFASSLIDVPERTLRRWRDKAQSTRDVPLDERISPTAKTTDRWVLGLIDGKEEELKMQIINYVHDNTNRRHGMKNLSAEDIMNYINNTLLAPYIAKKVPGVHQISLATTKRWLQKLGFHYESGKNRTGFVDGHEREDNVKAREEFVRKKGDLRQEATESVATNAETLKKIEILKKVIKQGMLM